MANNQKPKPKLSEVLKGTQVASWEMRINDKGQEVVYVRFRKPEKPVTATVHD